MERLSVTTAMVGLMAVGGNLTELLWDLNWEPHAETAAVNAALQEVKQYRSSVHVLYKTLSLLEAARLPFPDRGRWIRVDDLVATLTDTVLALSDLQRLCEAVDLEDQEDAGDAGALLQQYNARVSGLCARIRWHNITITMMMTVLKCPGDADAQTSRCGLEQRMTRLLTSNGDLSGRMRRLEDVFDARGNSESLPDYRASQQQPDPAAAPGVGPAPLRDAAAAAATTPNHQAGWSAFSGYTLADTPVLSIIALPVATAELRDGHAFYTFDFARRFNGDIAQLAPDPPAPDAAAAKKLAAMRRPGGGGGDGKLWMGLASTVRKLNRKRRKKRDATVVTSQM